MKKSTLILLGIFVILLAFVYFYEYKGGQEREKAKKLKSSLFKMNKNDIQSVTLIKNGEETVTYIRGEADNWRIISPITSEAEKSTVNGNINTFNNAKIKRTINTSTDRLANFGLNPANTEVVIKLQNGDEKHLLIGNETTTRGDLFVAWKDSSTVLVTTNSIKTQAEKSLFDIRDKKIAHFDDKKVQRLELTSENGEVVLEKSGDQWSMLVPYDAPVDQSRVRSFLSSLKNYRATEFVKEDFSESLTGGIQEEYGFDEPTARVVMSLGEERATKEVLVGKDAGEDSYYAYESGRSPLFLIRKTTKTALSKSPFYFQDRKIVKFEEGELTEIRFSGAYQWTLLKEDTLGWYAHSDTTIKVEDSQMRKLFGHFRSLNAKELVTHEPENLDAYGLKPPFLEVSLLSGDEEVGSFLVGNDVDKDRYIKSGTHPFIYLIVVPQIERITKWLDEL